MSAANAAPQGWASIWRGPEAFLLDAGATGEQLVARVRLAVTLLLMLSPLIGLQSDPRNPADHYVGLLAVLMAVGFSGLLLWMVNRELYRPWLGFVTAAVDVTIVTIALAMYLLLDRPHIAVNSRVVYQCYFIALGATCLRYDPRICLVAGALAMAQYLGIVLVAMTGWDLNSTAFAPFEYGTVTWVDQLSRLVLLGAMTVLATAVVVQIGRMRHLSLVDRLTGLPNRGYLDARFGAEVARARRHRRPMAVAMVDVDHFKRFNDSFGHAAGDAGLKALAVTVRRQLRTSDVVARYGGEEFVLLLPETGPEAAMEKLEAIRLAIANTIIQLPRQTTAVTLTVSIGLAILGPDGDDPHTLLDVADARLFHAKHTGRNRVVGPDGMPIPTGVLGQRVPAA